MSQYKLRSLSSEWIKMFQKMNQMAALCMVLDIVLTVAHYWMAQSHSMEWLEFILSLMVRRTWLDFERNFSFQPRLFSIHAKE